MKRRSTHLSTIRNDHPAALYGPETPEPDHPRVTRCCAKCRRGVPGFGDLPCGYAMRCPNDCHNPNKTTKENTNEHTS